MTNSTLSKHQEHQMNQQVYVKTDSIIAGNGNITINTGNVTIETHAKGNISQNSESKLMIGGVSTTPQELAKMNLALQHVQRTIESDTTIDAEDKELAQIEFRTLSEQLQAPKKPHSKLLSRAANTLYKISPAIAGTVVTLFSEPLVGQIISFAGGIALEFTQYLPRMAKGKKA